MPKKTNSPVQTEIPGNKKSKDVAKGSYNAELSSHPVNKQNKLPEDGSFTIINDEDSEVPVNGDVADIDLKADVENTENPTDDIDIVMGTEADVTEEDLKMLGHQNEDMDMNDDELIDEKGLDDTDFDGDQLNEGKADTASTGEELDIPGGEEDDANEALGEEDEENNYYSLDEQDDEKRQD